MSATSTDITKSVGTFGGLCNRTACREEAASWWNESTKKFYCLFCASKINLEARRFGEAPPCRFGGPDIIEA